VNEKDKENRRRMDSQDPSADLREFQKEESTKDITQENYPALL
jgi:hypothetical protein